MGDAGRALRGVTNKDTRAIMRKAMKAGCDVVITGATHVRITAPDGRFITTGLTASSRRAADYLRRDLRRIGVDV